MIVKIVTEQEFIELEAQVHSAMLAALGDYADRWTDITLAPRNSVTGLYGFPVPEGERAAIFPIEGVEILRTDAEWFDQTDILTTEYVIEFDNEIITIS